MLFKEPGIIKRYISNNPDKLNQNELSIIEQWTNFISGEFYIERYLKNYAIFIGKSKVYGVLALHNTFEEMFPTYCLPLYVKAILLPFKGRLIYDGLLQISNISFGGGIKRQLKETYMRAKKNHELVITLDESSQSVNNKLRDCKVKDWSKEIGQLEVISKKLKGGKDQPEINGLIFGLIKNSVELANQAVLNKSDIVALEKEMKKVKRSLKKIENHFNYMD